MNPDPDEHTHPGQEELHWGLGIKEKNREKKPSSSYWAIGEQARKMIPGESQCKMFCGGKTCKFCTADSWQPEQMVIKGLYSEWVTDHILAMARLSNHNLDKMVDQFKSCGVKTVINLQQPGEHAHCGFGLDSSGFSYNPQTLMEGGLFFYNFAMHDFGIAPLSTLLDIVKVMQFAVSLGKVAVHCHAGRGRTGLVIACYLIYNNRVQASKAVQYVRSRRGGSIQTKEQVSTCHEFEQYLQLFFVIFPSKIPGALEFSFSHFLVRQKNLLHGYEARKLKHIPKVVYVCCERLLELCGKGKALSSLRNAHIDPIPPDLISLADRNMNDGLHSDRFVTQEKSARGIPESSEASSEITSIGNKGLVPDSHSSSSHRNKEKAIGRHYHSSSNHRRNDEVSVPESHSSSSHKGNDNARDRGKRERNLFKPKNVKNMDDFHERASHDAGRSYGNEDDEAEDDDDDDCIVYGLTQEEMDLTAKQEVRKAEEEHIKLYKQRSRPNGSEAMNVVMSVQDVCQAILATECSQDILDLAHHIEDSLNKSDEAWLTLAREDKPEVVCAVLWDWLDQLNEPVLRAQDVYTLAEFSADPRAALLQLEKSTKEFLEYIALVLTKLRPASPQVEHAIVERFLCHLCQKHFGLGMFPLSTRQAHMGDERSEVSSRLFELFLRLLDMIEISKKK